MGQQEKVDSSKQTKVFFIGIDSDGCVFNSMVPKQKEFFCPNVIRYFGLLPVSEIARETWEYVNLYSKTRGINRFLALSLFFELLAEREEVSGKGIQYYNPEPLREWIKKETKLGDEALSEYARKVNIPEINLLLKWSLKVNEEIGQWVKGIKPFTYVGPVLNRIKKAADVAVVSQTPVGALAREWGENNIGEYADEIYGQEHGTKSEQLALATKGKYRDGNILMIGDSPGDLKAAKSNGVLFYPVIQGKEEASWKRLYEEGLDIFFSGRYGKTYEAELIEEFQANLLESPPWKKPGVGSVQCSVGRN